MNTKLLLIIALFFYIAWKKSGDDFFIFCIVHTLVLAIAVFLYKIDQKKEAPPIIPETPEKK